MKRTNVWIALALLTGAAGVSLAACSDDPVAPGTTDDAGPETSVALDDAATDGNVVTTKDAAVDSGPAVEATQLVTTNPGLGELVEGIAYRGTDTYVGYAPTGKIMKISASGEVTPYAQVPVSLVAPSKNFTLGLAFAADGALFVGVSSANPPDVLAPAGVYKIPPGGNDGGTLVNVPFAVHPSMAFPNGLAIDNAGTLWISDSTGTIFTVSATTGGVATPYLSHETLQGDNAACPLPGQAFPIGANGIAFDAAQTTLFVANTNKGTVISIPRLTDGGTPTPTVVAQDCAKLEGIDGLIVDSRTGNLIVTNNGQNSILRIVPSASGDAGTANIQTIYAGPPLDSPASIVEIPGSSNPQVFHVTNAAFVSSSLPSDAGVTPKPGLVRLTIK